MSFLSYLLGRRIRFPLQARSAQAVRFDLPLFRLFVDHDPDDTRRLFHRRFRVGTRRLERRCFC